MVFRVALLTAAICLALVGCKHQAKHRPHGRVAQPVRTHAPVAAKPAKIYLRGPVHNAAATPVVHSNAVAATPVAPYRLDSGDRLRIVVFGQENLSRTYSVDGGGFISMPLIGGVKARGRTTFDLERRIASQLRDGYVKDPKVTVEVQTYRPFFILGEVKNPGQFAYVNGMTVQTAVAIAGGYTERARESKVKLTRQINGRPAVTKVPVSFRIRPGDTIYVTERIF